MSSYFLKCKKNTENIIPKISRISNGKTMVLSSWAICCSKKSKFIEKQEANGLLSRLEIKTSLDKIPLVDPLFFNSHYNNSLK